MPRKHLGRQTRAVHAFTVRVERRSRLCVRVLVFEDATALRRAAREVGKRPESDVIGFCLSHARRRGGRLQPDFATICLTLQSRTTVITHEAFHATCRWAGRRGLELPLPPLREEKLWRQVVEERMAGVHDTICRRIVDKLYTLKVLT